MSFNSTSSSRGGLAPKRVCMIAYTNYRFDGRVRLEAESLVKWGYEVCFLVPREGTSARTYVLDGVAIKELAVDKYNGRNKLRYVLSYLTFLFLAFVVCTDLFVRSRVRVIHVHNMPDLLIFATVVPRLFKCNIVLDLHDTVPETYQAKFGKTSGLFVRLLRLEERVCCSLADRIICVNHVQREAVIQRGIPSNKISTVITMPRFVPHVRPLEEREQERVFRMVNHGTISKRLGNDLILEAAAKLIHEIPGFELHFIGAGDNLDQLLAQSRSLGLEDCVHFHDCVPWDNLAEKLSIMDVGIVANRVNVATELMLPSKLIDYVVLGIPAIVPRLRAIEYYFSEDMVEYFEAENVDSMVAATVSLYRDKARREQLPVKAKKFWDENQWERPGTGLRSLYQGVFLEPESGSQSVRIDAGLKISPEKAGQDKQEQYSTKP
jgi:glycosyltransferase involved in cell wall biosynthesis